MARPKGGVLENVQLDTLKLDPKNARKHSKKNLKAIKASLQKFGVQGALAIVGPDNTVLAGNGRVVAARELGLTEVPIFRTNLTGKAAAAFALADNRTAELAEWDFERLQETLTGLVKDEDLYAATGFTQEQLSKIVVANAAAIDDDELPVKAASRAKPGDIYQLGRHRLMCGDSTNKAQVAKLFAGAKPFIMVTDPPYGVMLDRTHLKKTNSSPKQVLAGSFGLATSMGKVLNDDRSDWREAYQLFADHGGIVAYVWCASLKLDVFMPSLVAAGFEVKSLIVWVKQAFVFGRSHYHWQHEPCLYATRGPAKWLGGRKQSTVWDIRMTCGFVKEKDEGAAKTNHASQKPVECMARPIRNHGGKSDIVYEPFCGSGTTLIAAEKIGRTCYAMELSPEYVDVAIARWEQVTKKKAVKAGE